MPTTITGTVTVTGANTFTVSTTEPAASGTGGTAARPAGLFSSASGAGLGVTIECSQAHNLTTGQYITIPVAVGFAGIVGNWYVTVVDTDTFTLDNSTGLTGSSSDVWWMPWPVGDGTGSGGTIVAGYGHTSLEVVDVTGQEITVAAPHGLRVDPVNLPGYPRVRTVSPTTAPIETTVTDTISATIAELQADLSALEAQLAELRLQMDTTSSELPERLGFGALDGPRQLSNVFRRLAGYRIRAVERATFVLAAAVPGYSAAALQTGEDLTNAYTITNDRVVFRQVVVYFKSPPLGSAARLDIKKNGTTILTAPLIYPDGQALPLRYNNFTSLNLEARKDDRLTVDVVAVGSSFAGCDATIHVLMGSLG